MAQTRGPDALATLDLAALAPAEIARIVRERLEQDREREDERRWEGVPEPTRHWLALAPPVTASVARAAGVPRTLLDTLAERGALRVQHPRYLEEHGGEDALYVVTEHARQAVLARVTADSGYATRVRSSIARFGDLVVKRASGGTAAAPAPLERWSALAARADHTPALIQHFDAMIDDATRREDAGAMLGWIESARPLATLLSRTLDPALEVALHRAGRRLELLHRHQQDRRHLKSFLRRKEQIEALRALVDGPDDAWALHLFGSGGVGKTMLLRYFEAELAPRQLRPHELPTARIDFDYLNADYPRLAPGLLLWSFGQELRRFADREAIDRFDRGDGYLRELHQRIRAEASTLDSAAATRDSAFIQAVELYIDAMRSLPQPVILVLDTCEELAKVRPDGTVPENVRETFRILEALHEGPRALLDERPKRSSTRDGLPSLRVVFAGRRPLAREGAGWRAERTVRPARPYLALHELRGFTAGEAHTFLARRLEVPDELVVPIIDATRETPPASPILWTDARRAPAGVARCNPYDLRLYADWANETPRPAPDVVRHATAAQYVELRILQRLDLEPLERIMPGLALVKHIDAGIVAAAGAFDESKTQFVFEQLAEQEWIELRRVSFRDGTEVRDVLTVDEGLRRALASYYDERGGVPQDMARRLADHLESRTRHDDLGDLDWSTFDAALRALESDGERLARWWGAVETRIVADRGVGWLRDVTGALLAGGAAAGPVEDGSAARRPRVSRIRAAVLASYATSLLGADGAADQVGGIWPEVLAEAGRVPDERLARRLRWRAVAGLCASHARNQTDPPADLLAELLRAGPDAAARGELDVELVASLLAAADALVERIEGGADPDAAAARAWFDRNGTDTANGLAELVRCLYWAADLETGPEDARAAAVKLWALTLAMRVARLRGRPGESAELFKVVVAMMRRGPSLTSSGMAVNPAGVELEPSTDAPSDRARPVHGGPEVHERSGTAGARDALRFADWLPPEDIGARVRLEALRALPDEPVGNLLDLLDLLGPVPLAAVTMDAARFLAARLRVVIAIRLPGDDEVVRPDGAGYAKPRCNAHRWAPPPTVSFAEAVAARGDVNAAVRTLRGFVSLGGQIDLHDLQHAERALLRLAFRHRLGAADAVSVSLAESRRPEDRELVWALLESSETERNEPSWPDLPRAAADRVRWLRAAWRTRNTRRADAHDGYRELLELDPGDDAVATALRLEILEVVGDVNKEAPALREFVDLTLDALWAGAEGGGRPNAAAARIRDMPPAEAWVAELSLLGQSMRAITGRFEQRLVRTIAIKVGERRAAEIALYEADLLAMRLPGRARRLYDLAARLFAIAEDATGERLVEQRINGLSAQASAPIAQAAAYPVAQPGSAPAGAAYPVAQPRPAPAGGRRRRAYALGLIVGFAVLTVFLAGTFLLFRWQVSRTRLFPAGEPITTGEMVAGYLGLMAVLLYGVPALVRWARSVLASRARVHFRLLAERGSNKLATFAASATADLVVAGWRFTMTAPHTVPPGPLAGLRRLRLPWVRPFVATWRFDIGYESGTAYDQLAARLPDDAAKLLASLMSRLRRRSAGLVIQVDRAAAAQPCEAILSRAGRPDLTASATPPLHARRRLAGRRATGRAPELPARPDVCVSVGSPIGEAMARRGWRRAADRGTTSITVSALKGASDGARIRAADRGVTFITVTASPSDGTSDAGIIRDAPVLHLLGNVVETNAGLRFRPLDGRESTRNIAVTSTTGPRQPTAILENAVERGVLLLSAADIDRRFGGPVLCILQAEPVRRFSERGASDRVQANLARAFAAELHLLGVPIVLVIPPVTPELGAELLDRLDRALMKPTRAAAKVERCVGDLQRRILRGADPKFSTSWEHAFDVTLYMGASEDGDASDPLVSLR